MKKYATVKISTKKKIINTESINMWIRHLTNLIILLIFRILRKNDVITTLYWTYEFGFKIRVSNLVRMLNFNR